MKIETVAQKLAAAQAAIATLEHVLALLRERRLTGTLSSVFYEAERELVRQRRLADGYLMRVQTYNRDKREVTS